MEKVFNLIIVDESGSMQTIREQAFVGMNDTIGTILEAQKEHENLEQSVTLLTFNSDKTTYHFLNVPASSAGKLKYEEYQPSACTPLYDAIGNGIAKINSLCELEDKVLVTIITDGYENSSREYGLKAIKNLISKMKKQNWIFTFIGTDDLDVKGMADNFGIVDFCSFDRTEEGTKKMFKKENNARKKIYYELAAHKDIKEGDYFKGM